MDSYKRSLLLSLLFLGISSAATARKVLTLYQPPRITMTYHNGALLEGDLHLNILWYGEFTPPQKSIILDFLASLEGKAAAAPGLRTPTVSKWWQTVQTYLQKAGKKQIRLILSNQISDENCSMGKLLKKWQVSELAERGNSEAGGLTLVLTAEDVAVEGFCMSNCGYHGEVAKRAFVWVGNSVSQCPGQCAWPFHQPIYGPQTEPLVAPNGDVGLDGMIVNIASLVAGAVTNPFGDGYHQGQLETASACTGVYGKGAYPGYAGDVLVDSATGGSYNAQGMKGRKYLLPALLHPNTSECSTLP